MSRILQNKSWTFGVAKCWKLGQPRKFGAAKSNPLRNWRESIHQFRVVISEILLFVTVYLTMWWLDCKRNNKIYKHHVDKKTRINSDNAATRECRWKSDINRSLRRKIPAEDNLQSTRNKNTNSQTISTKTHINNNVQKI